MKDLSGEDNRKSEFAKVYENNCGRIYNYVMMMTNGNTYLAEEITQITFVKVWEHIGALDDYEHIEGYMLRTARNLFLNLCNHTVIRRLYDTYVKEMQEKTEDTTEDEIDRLYMEQYLGTLLNKMSPMRCKVFKMSRYEGKNVKEIASELGLAPKTVENHLYLALKYIKENFNNMFGA